MNLQCNFLSIKPIYIFVAFIFPTLNLGSDVGSNDAEILFKRSKFAVLLNFAGSKVRNRAIFLCNKLDISIILVHFEPLDSISVVGKQLAASLPTAAWLLYRFRELFYLDRFPWQLGPISIVMQQETWISNVIGFFHHRVFLNSILSQLRL